MKFLLSKDLASHRRGRFLATLLGAMPADGLPDEGMLLMTGNEYQVADPTEKMRLQEWYRLPGRCLLLLPPYQEGVLFSDLDWRIAFKTGDATSEHSFVKKLVGELDYTIQGQDGSFDPGAGHQLSDFSCNTRYFRKHTGTGLVAATCLPLWSITLLDEDEITARWLEDLGLKAGKSSAELEPLTAPDDEGMVLGPDDYATLVCAYACGLGNPESITEALSSVPIPVIRIDAVALKDATQRLVEAQLLDDTGLTPKGLDELRRSPYWGYAETLKEEMA